MISRRQALLVTSSYLSYPNAFAQNDKSVIKLIVGASAGTDATARLIADRLREVLNRPVIVISKLGAGQRVALNELQRSAPDGRTLMLVTSAPFSIYPHIYAKLDYEPLKEFTPIASVSSFDVGMCTGPMTGAKDIGELVKWIRANPKQAIYGSAPGTEYSASDALCIACATARKITDELAHCRFANQRRRLAGCLPTHERCGKCHARSCDFT